MTIVAIFLFVVPFSCFCTVILLMGFADLWKQREAEKAQRMQQPNNDLAEKESRNERTIGSDAKLFRGRLEARGYASSGANESAWGGHSNPQLA